MISDALALIQQLEAQNAELSGKIGQLESQNRCFKENKESCEKRMIDLAQRMPRWISVEERLPENYISVIGYLPIDDKGGFPPTREVYRTEKGWFAPSLGELCIITHWMFMPEGFREV